MTESVFLTCVVDAHQKRDVATVDIPGAFMQTDMDNEVVHIRLTGEMARLLAEIDPDTYDEYMCRERGDDVIYAKLLKALYGTLRAARMFYDLLSSKFQEWGFEQNPYDPCVANKIIDGHQCTIVWHVDDLKISHVSAKVVDDIIGMLQEEFGKEDPLVVKRGPVHEYLGMTIDFTKPNKVMIDMKDYLEAMFEELSDYMETPEMMTGTAITPAANHLFQVRKESDDNKKLNTDEADMFHHITAKLLFVSQHGRPDIRTAISFLCGRVQQRPKEIKPCSEIPQEHQGIGTDPGRTTSPSR